MEHHFPVPVYKQGGNPKINENYEVLRLKVNKNSTPRPDIQCLLTDYVDGKFNRLHLCIKLLPDRHILFPLSKLCMKTIFQLNRGSQFYGWRNRSTINPTTIQSRLLWTLMVSVRPNKC